MKIKILFVAVVSSGREIIFLSELKDGRIINETENV